MIVAQNETRNFLVIGGLLVGVCSENLRIKYLIVSVPSKGTLVGTAWLISLTRPGLQ